MRIGPQLRTLREREHLSQEQAAARCGATLNTWSRWERDVFRPSWVALDKIAAAYGVSVDWLVGLPEERPGKKR